MNTPPNPRSEDPGGPQVLILGAGFNTHNRGVAALACGTLASVFHSLPNATVAVLDYAKAPATYDFRHRDRTHAVELIPLRFSKNPFQPNHVLRLLLTAVLLRLLPSGRRARWIAQNPWLRPIEEARIIGALSGGDSFSDLYGLRRLLYVSLPQLLVLALGRPLTLLPQSYGPFASRSARFVAGCIFRRARHIFSRDTEGLDVIRRLEPEAASRAAFAYDMGFALEPREPPVAVLRQLLRLKRSRPLVGLNISGLLYGKDGTDSGHFGLRVPYAELLHDLIVELVQHKGFAVVLIPHVFGLGGESDVTASLKLWHRLPVSLAADVTLLDRELDQHEIKYLIGQCDFFIGARMHACIAALSQAVPTVALAYSRKFAGVLGSIDAQQLVIDLRDCDRPGFIAAINATFADRGPLRAKLAARNPAVRENILGFFRRLHSSGPGPSEPAPESILQQRLDPA